MLPNPGVQRTGAADAERYTNWYCCVMRNKLLLAHDSIVPAQGAEKVL